MSSQQVTYHDDIYANDLLTAAHRRHTIDILSQADNPMPLADVAMAIAEREGSKASGADRYTLAKRIRLALYHTHVPKLVDADVVEYNDARRTVTLADTEARSVIEAVTRMVNSDELPHLIPE